VISLKRQRHGS